MKIKSTQLSQTWNHLGDFWGKFEDRDIVDNWWEAAMSAITDMYKKSYWTSYSRSIKYLDPIISGLDYYFPVYYGDTIPSMSGLLNINVSGEYNPGIGSILNIDSLVNVYYQNEENPFTEEVIESGTQYNLSTNREYITFEDHETDLTTNANQSNINYSMLYASGTSIINPFLFNYWGRLVDVDINNYLDGDYNSYLTSINSRLCTTNEKDLIFYKYFIWALIHLRKKAYTLDTIENLLGISYGLPFAFESGVVTDISASGDDTAITISGELGNIVYTIPNIVDNYIILGEDDAVDTFQLLVSGFILDDYISDLSLIDTYASGTARKFSTLVLTIPSALSGLSYKETIASGVVEDVIGEGVQLFYYNPLTAFEGFLEEESALDFGATYSGETTFRQALYLSNLSSNALDDITYEFSNSDFSCEATVPSGLVASGEIVVPVVFTPSSLGRSTTDLTVEYTTGSVDYYNTFTDVAVGSGISADTLSGVFVATTGDNDTGDGTKANPYASVCTGIFNANLGDTVYIREGTYAEEIRDILPNSGTSWGSGLSVWGYPGETVEIRPDITPTGYAVLVDSGCAYIDFYNIHFNAVNMQDYGRAASNNGYAHHITYSGCIFEGSLVASGSVFSSYAHHLNLIDCELYNATSHAIYLAGSRTVGYAASSGLIDNCYIHNVGKYGIHCNNEDRPAEGSHPDESWEHTVTMNDNIFRNNRIEYCASGSAIIFAGARRAQAYNNVINNCYGGVYFTWSRNYDCEVYNNTIAPTGRAGIYIDNYRTNGAIIYNNIIGSGYTDDGFGSISEYNVSGALDADIKNNLLQTDYRVDGVISGVDASNIIEADLGVAEEESNVYTLNPTSSGIDAGYNVSTVRIPDYYGRVPKGDGYDLGAFEFEADLVYITGATYVLTVDAEQDISHTNEHTASGAFRSIDARYADIVASGYETINITFAKEDFTGEDNLNRIHLPSGGTVPITIQGTGAEAGNRTRLTAVTTLSGIQDYFDTNHAGWRDYMATGVIWDWGKFTSDDYSPLGSGERFRPYPYKTADEIGFMPYVEYSGAYRWDFDAEEHVWEAFDGYTILFFPAFSYSSHRAYTQVESPVVINKSTGEVFDQYYYSSLRVDSGLVYPQLQHPCSTFWQDDEYQEVTPWMFTPLGSGETHKLIYYHPGSTSVAASGIFSNINTYSLWLYWRGQYLKISGGVDPDDHYDFAWNGTSDGYDAPGSDEEKYAAYRDAWIISGNAQNLTIRNIDFYGPLSANFLSLGKINDWGNIYGFNADDDYHNYPGGGTGDSHGIIRMEPARTESGNTLDSIAIPSGITFSDVSIAGTYVGLVGWATDLTINDCNFSGVVNYGLRIGNTGPVTYGSYDPVGEEWEYNHDMLRNLNMTNCNFFNIGIHGCRISDFSGGVLDGLTFSGMLSSWAPITSQWGFQGGFQAMRCSGVHILDSYFEDVAFQMGGVDMVMSGCTLHDTLPESVQPLVFQIGGPGFPGDHWGSDQTSWRINTNRIIDSCNFLDCIGDVLFEGSPASNYPDGVIIDNSGVTFINNFIRGKQWNVESVITGKGTSSPSEHDYTGKVDTGNPPLWVSDTHGFTMSGNVIVGGDPIAWDAYDNTKSLFPTIALFDGVSEFKIQDNKFAYGLGAINFTPYSGARYFGGIGPGIIENNTFYNMSWYYLGFNLRPWVHLTRTGNSGFVEYDDRPDISPNDVLAGAYFGVKGHAGDPYNMLSGYAHDQLQISNNKFIYQPADCPEWSGQALNYYGTDWSLYPRTSNVENSGLTHLPVLFDVKAYDSSFSSSVSGVFGDFPYYDELIWECGAAALQPLDQLANKDRPYPINSGSTFTDNVTYGMSGNYSTWIEYRPSGYYYTQISGTWYPPFDGYASNYGGGVHAYTFTVGEPYDEFLALASGNVYWFRGPTPYPDRYQFGTSAYLTYTGTGTYTAIPQYDRVRTDPKDLTTYPSMPTVSGLFYYLDNENEGDFVGTGNTVSGTITFTSTDVNNASFLDEA